MCALGNDFIVIDERERARNWQMRQVQRLCDRRFGVGADQLLLIRKSGKADASMHIYNQDGSKAKQCGNGLRAVASWLLIKKQSQRVDIEVGNFVHRCQLIAENWIQVSFPQPMIKPSQYQMTECNVEFGYALEVDVGNPHLVLWRKSDQPSHHFNQLGAAIQQQYQDGINVHAVKALAKNRIYIEHWERGAGITLSCGSGSVACVFAGIHLGLLASKVVVENSIGELSITCVKDEILLTGAIKHVFDGSIREML